MWLSETKGTFGKVPNKTKFKSNLFYILLGIAFFENVIIKWCWTYLVFVCKMELESRLRILKFILRHDSIMESLLECGPIVPLTGQLPTRY